MWLYWILFLSLLFCYFHSHCDFFQVKVDPSRPPSLAWKRKLNNEEHDLSQFGLTLREKITLVFFWTLILLLPPWAVALSHTVYLLKEVFVPRSMELNIVQACIWAQQLKKYMYILSLYPFWRRTKQEIYYSNREQNILLHS